MRYSCHMDFHLELEQETDGRWIAEIPELLGVLVYGETRELAKQKVQALALRVLADGLECGQIAATTFSFALWADSEQPNPLEF